MRVFMFVRSLVLLCHTSDKLTKLTKLSKFSSLSQLTQHISYLSFAVKFGGILTFGKY